MAGQVILDVLDSALRPRCSYSVLIVILLLISGLWSVVERTLLASVQFRQSPSTPLLFGFLVFAADGIKLFAKATLGDSSRTQMGKLVLGLFPLVGLLAFELASVGVPSSARTSGSKPLFVFLLLVLAEHLELLVLTFQANHFAAVAVARAFFVFVVGELTVGLILSVCIFADRLGSTSTAGTTLGSLEIFSSMGWVFVTFLVLLPLLLAASAAAPFDLTEAESELIDGVSTELASVAFSVVYAFELVAAALVGKVIIAFTMFG